MKFQTKTEAEIETPYHHYWVRHPFLKSVTNVRLVDL